MSDHSIAGDVDGLEGAIDQALARSVLYHAVTLGLRPPAEAGPSGFGTPESAAIREAAMLLDSPGSSALLPAVETLCDRAAHAGRLESHARLFGHSRGLVCPFETEYGSGGPFRQPQELADIAGSYLAFGLRPGEGGDERVDHAACECEFVDFLARKEAFGLASLLASDDREETREMLGTVQGATRGFLRAHLGRFGRAFASQLMREDPDGFHGTLGSVLFRFLTLECERFGLPPGPPCLELRPPMADDDTPMACGRADQELIQIQTRPRP